MATGADLVAYSGFSASNYLEQPYNSDLDFGTGDFCVMGWVKGGNVLNRNSPIVYKNAGFDCRINFSTGYPSFWDGTTRLSGNISLANSPWSHVSFVRKAGVGYIYVNGVLNFSGPLAADVNSVNPMLVGRGAATDYLEAGSLAILRISATAPTAEQIKKVYNDEKVLFQEGAQATLYGDSDAVTALAYDDSTNLLHVGTSGSGNGRSVFQGLRRVDNTTLGVGVAISASNGLVVEE